VISYMRMDHVSLTVRDLDRSIEFYSKAFGMKLLRKSIVNPVPGVKYKNACMCSDHFLLELATGEPDEEV